MDTRELRYKLARKFYTVDAIVAVCRDAGVDYVYVNLHGPPIEVWSDVLYHVAHRVTPGVRDNAMASFTALVKDAWGPTSRCSECGGTILGSEVT
jgi:hypothetical protein